MNDAVVFLNTDFSTATTIDNGDGTTTTTTTDNEAPDLVKLWVWNRIAQLYENRGVPVPADYSMLQPFRVYPFKG